MNPASAHVFEWCGRETGAGRGESGCPASVIKKVIAGRVGHFVRRSLSFLVHG